MPAAASSAAGTGSRPKCRASGGSSMSAAARCSAEAECEAAADPITPNWEVVPAGPCLFVGADRLQRDGALAIDFGPAGLDVRGARAVNRGRPWTRDPDAPPLRLAGG